MNLSRKAVKLYSITRLVVVEDDPSIHAKKMRRGFIGTLIFAICYGIYEYFIVYKFLIWRNIVEQANWAIMIVGYTIVVCIATKCNIELWAVNLLGLFIIEDFTYWMCMWIELGTYPFPVTDWFDAWFASFRVLGYIGQAMPFWSRMPVFYIPGFASIVLYYRAGWRSAKRSRIIAWIIGPFFIAIIAGTLVTEIEALYILILLPSISTCLGILVLAFVLKNKEDFSKKSFPAT